MKTALVVLALLALSLTALAADVGQQPLDLRLRYQKGDTYQLNVTIEQKWFHGDEETQTDAIKLTMTMEVLGFKDAGNVLVKMTFDRYIALARNGDVAFDSDNPPERPDPITAVKACIVGQSFRAILSPRSEVLKIGYAGELQKAILDAAGPGAAISCTGGFDVTGLEKNDGIKEFLTLLLARYPDGPVTVGATWTQKEEQGGLVCENTYKLESRQNGVATVQAEGPVTQGSSREGLGWEAYRINEASGAIVAAKLLTRLGFASNLVHLDENGEETGREVSRMSMVITTLVKWQKLPKQ